MQTRSIGPISCSTSCSTWSGSPRSARMPPCILGCSVLTRPPSISGAPVTSETGTTLTPASVRPAARVSRPPFCRIPRSGPAVSYLHPPQEIVCDSPNEQPVLYRVQPSEQRLLRILRQNRHPLLRDDRPGVYFLDHEMHRHPRLFDPRLQRLLHGAKPAELGQERRMNVQHSREAIQEASREYPHVPGPHHQPDVVSFDPGRKLPIVVFLADERSGVDVLDRNSGPPRPLERERLLVVPRDDNKVLGICVEQCLQVRPRTRSQHGEARAFGQPLRQTLGPLPL